MTNEDVLIQVIKILIKENKELKSELEMYKINNVSSQEYINELHDKYSDLQNGIKVTPYFPKEGK